MEKLHTHNDAKTPMLRQYQSIKRRYPDSILLFRLGDFYEMFFEDAKIASNILDITLTSRNRNETNPVPLCGVPYHSVEPYIAKLIAAGKKVAVCDQMEDPKQAKGIVKRDVTRLISPGIVPDGLGIDLNSNNFIVSVVRDVSGGVGFAIADVSTGFFRAGEVNNLDVFLEEMKRCEPSEIVLTNELFNDQPFSDKLYRNLSSAAVSELGQDHDSFVSIDTLSGSEKFNDKIMAKQAADNLILYVNESFRNSKSQISSIEPYDTNFVMRLDESTIRNLELTRTMMDGLRDGSLLDVLDLTKTAAGARKLKSWILYPLLDVEEIEQRQSAVKMLFDDGVLSQHLIGILSEIYDIERLIGKATIGSINPRDFIALKKSLIAVSKLGDLLSDKEGYLGDLIREANFSDEILNKIENTIIDDPPFSIREGGFIKKGVSNELDELRAIISSGKDFIAAIESEEKKKTGIGSLKIKFNKVFGYYLEVTNSHKNKVPPHYIRRQTLANAERYITPELKEYEEKVLSAEEKTRAMETEIFSALKKLILDNIMPLQKTAGSVAIIDVLNSFARTALQYDFVMPNMEDSVRLEIIEGRHPIVEAIAPAEKFVPNDVVLNDSDKKFLMITGPNMAGKSTVMRQTAIIALMAQIGSFVPAKSATIGIVDRIFTRVGASDALAQGKSTFMVEMSEAAMILKYATNRSLIIIDEIGRGTSTFDGLAIAWAVAEDLRDRVCARTMFATHYHELTDLATTKQGICNMQIAVKEWNGEVVFLRKLMPGGTSRSYGIQVAKLAGLPMKVIDRANEVLENLENTEFDEIGRPRLSLHHDQSGKSVDGDQSQFQLFVPREEHEIIKSLKKLDITNTTPLDALNILSDMKKKI